jgi:hypothetical protein
VRKTRKKGEGGSDGRSMKRPKRRVLGLKSITKTTRIGQGEAATLAHYQHKAAAKKTRLSPSTAATPQPAKTRPVPKPPPFKPKSLSSRAATKPHTMTPRPLPRLAVSPVRRPAALRLPILRLSEPLPETTYKEAKAQLRLMRRAARMLRKADRANERTVKELVRHAAHDCFERQRQAGEATRELRRQQWEEDRADALRPAQPTRPSGQPPML